MTHHAGPACTDPGAYGERELAAAAHPGLGRQDQALSRSRPLRLRAARTARPARVRIRSRKPCVFARRRLFGWNVRLLTGTPDKGILDCTHAGLRAVLGFPTGYHLEQRRLPGVPSGRVLGCGKLFSPGCHGHAVQQGSHVHNMWIQLWIVSLRLAAAGLEGSTGGEFGPGGCMGTIPRRPG